MGRSECGGLSMEMQGEGGDGGLRDWRPPPGRGGAGARVCGKARHALAGGFVRRLRAQPRRAEACLACPRRLQAYLSALERQPREPAGRVGDGLTSCEGGVRLWDPPPTTPLRPASARARPSHHPDGQMPITAENAVFPHAAAALYPLEIDNLTLSGKRRFFPVPRSKFACESLPSLMSRTYTVSLCESDSCI